MSSFREKFRSSLDRVSKAEEEIKSAIATANQRLKQGNTGLVIFQRGSKLSLRGMLPPKPGSNKINKSQQTLPLDVYANYAGIKFAEKTAHKISGLLALKEFDWNDYLTATTTLKSTGTIEHYIEEFERDYFSKRARTPETETTWKLDYQAILKKLPCDLKLTNEILLELILASKPDTKTRKRTCMVTKALARFADLDFDPTPYSGSYSPKEVQPRDIPSDLEIAQWYDRFNEKYGYKYAFGLMAAYGLRNYEIFYLDLESLVKAPGHAYVTDGVNGARKIWCLYPEWWEKWQLYKIDRPLPKIEIEGKSNSQLGAKIGRGFGRYGFKSPYNLRHAWAIRSLYFGMPVEMAARMMDHSVKVHVETYQRWINDEHERKIYELMMSRSDRPTAPKN